MTKTLDTTVTAEIYSIGALLRPHFRRTLFESDIKFEECKGWITSSFRVTAPAWMHILLAKHLDEISKSTEFLSFPKRKTEAVRHVAARLDVTIKSVNEGRFRTKMTVRGHLENIEALRKAIKSM